jgi:hypothetical protein
LDEKHSKIEIQTGKPLLNYKLYCKTCNIGDMAVQSVVTERLGFDKQWISQSVRGSSLVPVE